MQIKILDTDRFFTDSPNTGEAACICSRCHQQIKEGEVPIRVAIDEKGFSTRNPASGEFKKLDDNVHLGGYEFRLCEKCYDQAIK